MKTWWTKFKLSQALDERRLPVTGGKNDDTETSECPTFAVSMRELDAKLRRARPTASAPAGLHDSVMRAVRATAQPATIETSWREWAWRGVPATAAAGIAVAGLAWWFLPARVSPGSANAPAPPPANLAVASTSTMKVSQRVAFDAPAAVLAPLEREMELFQSDVRKAAQLAMASLP